MGDGWESDPDFVDSAAIEALEEAEGISRLGEERTGFVENAITA